MTETVLRAVNLTGLMTALLLTRHTTSDPVAALAAWLTLSAVSAWWGRRVRGFAALGDAAIASWAISWASLWNTDLFLFLLLPAALSGLCFGPAVGAGVGAAAAAMQAWNASGALEGPDIAVRCGVLIFLPMAVTILAQTLRSESSRRTRELLNELRRAQVGEYLSYVLYQLREYLVSVASTAESLALSIPQDQPPLQERAERLKRLVAELNDKTARLLGEQSALTTSRKPCSETFDIDALTVETIHGAQTAFNAASVRLRIIREGEIVPVCSDKRCLRLTLLATLQNSLEALNAKGGGEVTVFLRRDAEEIHLMVTDDAGGMRGVNPEQLFEPIHCARTATSGLGLGLPIARRLMERAGGGLKVRSRDGLTSALIIVPIQRKLPMLSNDTTTWSERRAS